MTLFEKQEKRILEVLGTKVTPEILEEINECLVSPYLCASCKVYMTTPICPDCEPDKIPAKCAHLCTYCGNIYSHEVFKCFRAELGLCERCQGFENELAWEKLRKESGVKVDSDHFNFCINEKERCLEKLNTDQMTMEELEKHIFNIEIEISKLKAVSGGARSARITKMQDDNEKGVKTDRDLFLVYEQDKANKKEQKAAIKKEGVFKTKLEKTIEQFEKMGMSRAKAEKFAKEMEKD